MAVFPLSKHIHLLADHSSVITPGDDSKTIPKHDNLPTAARARTEELTTLLALSMCDAWQEVYGPALDHDDPRKPKGWTWGFQTENDQQPLGTRIENRQNTRLKAHVPFFGLVFQQENGQKAFTVRWLSPCTLCNFCMSLLFGLWFLWLCVEDLLEFGQYNFRSACAASIAYACRGVASVSPCCCRRCAASGGMKCTVLACSMAKTCDMPLGFTLRAFAHHSSPCPCRASSCCASAHLVSSHLRKDVGTHCLGCILEGEGLTRELQTRWKLTAIRTSVGQTLTELSRLHQSSNASGLRFWQKGITW